MCESSRTIYPRCGGVWFHCRSPPRHVSAEGTSYGYAAQKVTLIVLGQKLGQVHVRLGHRGLRMLRG